MTAAVARLDTTVTGLLATHGGVRPVEQGEGDSFVAAFARASDAVECALDLQRAPLAPIQLRIGVYTGQVQLRSQSSGDGNYIGPTINRTARLRDLAHGGQTVLSGATEQLVADWLPDGAWLTHLGSHELRDLPRPERVPSCAIQTCATSSRRRIGNVRYPSYQPAYEKSVAEVAKAMPDNEFHEAWAEGAALSATEAIAYAQRGRGERKRPSSGWAALTPAELDIVALVSEGLGNRDVAARLFVSPRTVQSHLTRVYTKLGLTSRLQLAQEATRRSAQSASQAR